MGEVGVNPALSRNREKIFSSRNTQHIYLSTRRGLRGEDSHLVSLYAFVNLSAREAIMFSDISTEARKFFSAIFVAVLVVGGTSLWSTQTRANCVTVLIDYGSLDSSNADFEKCLPVTGEITALELMQNANFKLEGTNKYGNNVVCRLNNLPKPNQAIGVKGHEDYIEECKEMPAAFAYWAVLEKRWQIIPNPFDLNGKWAWAQVGVAELAMKQGDGLAFVFVTNGDVKFPD